MSVNQDIRIGDVDTKLVLHIHDNGNALDVSAASSIEITIKRPDGTKVTKSGVYNTDGVDGKVYYLTDIDDITMAGSYYIQAKVVLAQWSGYSTIGKFTVENNL